MEENPKARGGHARAKVLSKEERQESARRAALARWSVDLPQATHEAPVRIGDKEIMAAVLPNGKRLLSQGTFLRALGRSRTPKAGTGGFSKVDGLPFFLQAEQLNPFISEELRLSTTPILFVSKTGRRTVGYDAELLPMVCEVYLKLRDASGGKVPRQYGHIIETCDILMRGLARVGIIALIDEATGYQEVRDRQALQAILDKFLRKELAAWAKRFPNEFYHEIFRLRGWEWKEMATRRPHAVANYTNDIVYARLAPGILEELQARNPKDERGRRKAKHHQWLTEDVGHPALAQHLYAVMGLMRASTSWQQFMTMLNIAFPKRGDTLMMAFMSEIDAVQT
ncbi:MAG: hypothetical protein H0W59_01290 [Chloroflexia bacterium]|nr:hypothetical protein [Hyphomicrobiales bacterium]MBA3642695.1 hypothetical protein [Chloroflexia bacterium]